MQTFSESSTNTETKEEETNNDTSYEYDETSLNKMDAEIDNAISVLRGDADVIHDAWREIHNLREVVNRSAEDSESRLQNTSRKDAPFTDKDNKTSGVRGDESSRGQIYSLQSQDPAILMSSADVTH